MRVVRKLLPWLIAAVLFAYLFTRYPLESVLSATGQVKPLLFIGFLLLYFLYFSLVDGWSLSKCLVKFGIHGSLTGLLRLRMASNLAMIVNYGAGHGFFSYLITRHYHVPFSRSTGVLFVVLTIDLYLALTIAFTASFFTQPVIDQRPLAGWIQVLWGGSTLSLAAAVITLRKWSIPTTPRWSTISGLLSAIRQSTFLDILEISLWRLPLHAATSTYLFFLAPCFGVSIPLGAVITLLPLGIIIGAIPITPSGLGTIQAVTIYFFQGYVSGHDQYPNMSSPAEVLLAMSLLFTLGIYILKLISGLLFLRGAWPPSARGANNVPP